MSPLSIPSPTTTVTSREGRVSRNAGKEAIENAPEVTSREGRVSRNCDRPFCRADILRHVPRGACE